MPILEIGDDGMLHVPGFPESALREALLNAVVHKDYRAAIPIQISVYEDRIVFLNPGVLPESWTLKRLLGKHPSEPFNPLIANAFFRRVHRGVGTRHCEDRERMSHPWH